MALSCAKPIQQCTKNDSLMSALIIAGEVAHSRAAAQVQLALSAPLKIY